MNRIFVIAIKIQVEADEMILGTSEYANLAFVCCSHQQAAS